jgi:hypothetical protein
MIAQRIRPRFQMTVIQIPPSKPAANRTGLLPYLLCTPQHGGIGRGRAHDGIWSIHAGDVETHVSDRLEDSDRLTASKTFDEQAALSDPYG